MPSSPGYKRDYQQERKTAIRRGETGTGHNAGDSIRHRARRKKEKELGHKLSSSQHVDHKNKVKNGGSNGSKNLRVMSASKNMADGGRSGNTAGKAAGARKANRKKGILSK